MKEGIIITSGSTVLPAPSQMSVDDEIIWTSDTGRTLAGRMMGDVIAEKKNIKIEWGPLTETDVNLIKKYLTTGFYPITFHDDGEDITIDVYRGTMSKVHLGDIGDGNYWYRSISVNLIER